MMTSRIGLNSAIAGLLHSAEPGFPLSCRAHHLMFAEGDIRRARHALARRKHVATTV